LPIVIVDPSTMKVIVVATGYGAEKISETAKLFFKDVEEILFPFKLTISEFDDVIDETIDKIKEIVESTEGDVGLIIKAPMTLILMLGAKIPKDIMKRIILFSWNSKLKCYIGWKYPNYCL